MNLLKSKKGVHVDFLNVDPFFHQDVLPLINSENVINIDVSLDKPYYMLNALKRLKVALLIKKKVSSYNDYNIVLLGDLGILEFYLAKNIKLQNSAKLFLIQDSILLFPEKYSLKKRIRKIFYGLKARQNICESIFVSGEATRRTLLSDNVIPDKVCNVGIPRFKYLFSSNANHKNLEDHKTKILFLTEAYTWHGHKNIEKQQRNFISFLDNFALNNRSSIDLSIRRHPRDYSDYDLKNSQIIDCNSQTVLESLRTNDIILSYLIPSTVLFEAIWLGKKVALVNPDKRLYSYKVSSKAELSRAFNFVSMADLPRFIKNVKDFEGDNSFEINNHFINEKSKVSDIIISKTIIDLSYNN